MYGYEEALKDEKTCKITKGLNRKVRREDQFSPSENPQVANSPYPCGISCFRVVLKHPGHAEVRHFADQVAIDQNVPRGQIPMHVTHVRQILHPRPNATEHAHQLDDREAAVILLRAEGIRNAH